MAIWTRGIPTREQLAEASKNTAVATMGIEYVEIGEDYVIGRIPVDERTVQPFGILHGGSSVVLAETLGSMAANYCLRKEGQIAVGLDINANHIRSVTKGWVYGTARPVHIGGTTQVWEIKLENGTSRAIL